MPLAARPCRPARRGPAPGPDGAPVVYVAPTWSGHPAEGAAEDGPVHALARLGTPLLADIGPAARSVGLAATDAMFPVGRRGAIRTRTVARMSRPVIEVVERGAQAFTAPFSAVLLHQFHGAATRVPLDSTAFGRREPHRMVEIISLWEEGGAGDGDGGARHLRWAEQLHAALAPFSLPGGYVNFLGPETPTRSRAPTGPTPSDCSP